MTYDQLIAIKEEESFLENLEIIDLSGYVCINDKVALPVVTSFSFERSNDIDLKYESGNIIGILKFLTGIIDSISGYFNIRKSLMITYSILIISFIIVYILIKTTK